MAERLQKFLAKSGIGSRRYCEELIKSKKIKVNGQIALIGATVNRNDEVDFDLLPEGKSKTRWISIGRLDINSSGLMLFTNDGTFANYCMHPSSSIDREYLVRARGDFTKEKKEKMLSGIKIDNDIYRFTDIVEGEKQSSNQWFSVCLMSGKNREVRKIFNAVGLEISRLKRTRFGPIFLPSSLKKGGYIELSSKEIDSIKNYGI